jgi:hypothetical protein
MQTTAPSLVLLLLSLLLLAILPRTTKTAPSGTVTTQVVSQKLAVTFIDPQNSLDFECRFLENGTDIGYSMLWSYLQLTEVRSFFNCPQLSHSFTHPLSES